MPTNYPGALDTLTNPTSSDTLASVDHAAQHANINDAMEAVQAELGTNPRGDSVSVAARLAAIEAPITSRRATRQASAQTAAAAGEVKFQFRDIARAALLAVRADVGDELLLFPPFTHPFLTGVWVTNSTTVALKSCASVTSGTLTGSTLLNSIRAINCQTSTAAGSEAVWVDPPGILRDGSSPGDGYLVWGLTGYPDASYGSGATGCVNRIGVYATSAIVNDGNRPASACALLEYNTVQGDTNWQLVVHNGTNVATADTGLAFENECALFYVIHSPRGGGATYAYIHNLVTGNSGSASLARNTNSTLLGRYSGTVTRDSVARNHRFASQFVLVGGQI